MYFLYNLTLLSISFFLKIIALFQPKINLFVKGRRNSFPILENGISDNDNVIWVHTASLGEFEQGLPIIEKLRDHYPAYKILLTFFSPSGYEVKKDSKAADLICYLPLDSSSNARRFIHSVHPKIAVFVKYEIWPNYMRELERNNIPSILISAIFKKDQIYFKWYGAFMRNVLRKMEYFFVQNEASKTLLNAIGITSIKVSGDTRFDRVASIKKRDNSLSFMEKFKQHKKCFVAGSSWPDDEKFLIPFINASKAAVKYVIAPHNIKKDHIDSLRKSLSKKTILYSDLKNSDLSNTDVIIIDTIGLLTKIYSYADVAYVGGGFATGLHNTLEPVVFGIPAIIGPNYIGFKEAEDLVEHKGVFVINSFSDFESITKKLLTDEVFRVNAGNLNSSYIAKNKGASIQIIQHIRTLL